MGEAIKPDLVLNMKREWLAKVWNGEKEWYHITPRLLGIINDRLQIKKGK